METIRLTICDTSVYADELRALLQANGIESFIYDETKTEVIGPVAGRAGFEVFVNKNDYEAALRVWESVKKKRDEQMPWCPKCGNEELNKTVMLHKHGPIWMLAIIIAVFILCVVMSFINPEHIYIPGIIWIFAMIIWLKSYNVEIYLCDKCGETLKKIKY